MNPDRILEGLNPEQKKAVMCTEGPLLVFAGAGSGKTKVITNRIAYLITQKSVKSEDILAVTFTKKAAGEMQERVTKILQDLGEEGVKIPLIGTFHSIGAIMLRQNAEIVGLGNNFSIYDSDDSEIVPAIHPYPPEDYTLFSFLFYRTSGLCRICPLQ